MERAYFAMIEYLDAYWKRGGSDEIAGMLGDLHFISDTNTMDPACLEDWKEAWDKTSGKKRTDYFISLTK